MHSAMCPCERRILVTQTYGEASDVLPFYSITLTICLTDTVILTDWKYLGQTAVSCDGQPYNPA